MALNPTIFKTRSLTAVVFVIVMLAGLLWNQWSFFVLFSIIHFGAWYEYQKLIAGIDGQYATISPFHRYGVMIAGWCLMWYFTNEEGYRIGNISFHVIGWWTGLVFLFVLPLGEIIFTRKINVKNILYSAAGLVYISLSLALLTHLRTLFYGNIVSFWGSLLVLIIIGSIWINDTMAYVVGSLIGKTPFSKISPKKTWEGTLGGIILAVIVIGVIGFFFTRRVSGTADWGWTLQWAVIAAIAAIAGTAGDLLESKLKRMAGVKDSGHIMPGHGGFLDRFDSLLVATPFVWLYVMWLLW